MPISINTQNLELFEQSQITADAGEAGNGGNITIDSDTIIGLENSDLTANAFMGNGGNINIDSDLILGLEPRLELTDFSDLTASSNLGIDGTVEIEALETNLQSELKQQLLEFPATEDTIANSCLARDSRRSSFTFGGTNRLPTSPSSNYSDTESTLTGVGSLPAFNRQDSAPIQNNNRPSNQSILPAKKMVETQSGRIFLVAAPPTKESVVCTPTRGKK